MADPESHIRLDPAVVRLINRSAELASRDRATSVTLRHVLWAMLRMPATPALEQHLFRAAELAEDAANSAVGDLQLLLAIVEDDLSMGHQVLTHFADGAALQAALRLQVEHFDRVEDSDETESEES